MPLPRVLDGLRRLQPAPLRRNDLGRRAITIPAAGVNIDKLFRMILQLAKTLLPTAWRFDGLRLMIEWQPERCRNSRELWRLEAEEQSHDLVRYLVVFRAPNSVQKQIAQHQPRKERCRQGASSHF